MEICASCLRLSHSFCSSFGALSTCVKHETGLTIFVGSLSAALLPMQVQPSGVFIAMGSLGLSLFRTILSVAKTCVVLHPNKISIDGFSGNFGKLILFRCGKSCFLSFQSTIQQFRAIPLTVQASMVLVCSPSIDETWSSTRYCGPSIST